MFINEIPHTARAVPRSRVHPLSETSILASADNPTAAVDKFGNDSVFEFAGDKDKEGMGKETKAISSSIPGAG